MSLAKAWDCAEQSRERDRSLHSYGAIDGGKQVPDDETGVRRIGVKQETREVWSCRNKNRCYNGVAGRVKCDDRMEIVASKSTASSSGITLSMHLGKSWSLIYH